MYGCRKYVYSFTCITNRNDGDDDVSYDYMDNRILLYDDYNILSHCLVRYVWI